VIEPTDEMVQLVYERIDFWNHGSDGIREGLVDVFALVERDYDVRDRTSHGWPARVWPLNRGALHPHYCVTCSDGHAMGPGCINCRQTGYDQTPWPNCQECRP
jgi:hypothetical protein